MAGVSRSEFLDALGRHKVTPFQYDADEILADVQAMTEWLARTEPETVGRAA